MTRVRGTSKHFSLGEAFRAQDFLVRQEKGNLHFPLEKVPTAASPPPPPQTSQALTEICMKVLTKRTKSIVTLDCPAGATPRSERNFLFPQGSWSLCTPGRRGTKTFLSHIPSDAERLVCALPSHTDVKQFWYSLIAPSFPERRWKQNYKFSARFQFGKEWGGPDIYNRCKVLADP